MSHNVSVEEWIAWKANVFLDYAHALDSQQNWDVFESPSNADFKGSRKWWSPWTSPRAKLPSCGISFHQLNRAKFEKNIKQHPPLPLALTSAFLYKWEAEIDSHSLDRPHSNKHIFPFQCKVGRRICSQELESKSGVVKLASNHHFSLSLCLSPNVPPPLPPSQGGFPASKLFVEEKGHRKKNGSGRKF